MQMSDSAAREKIIGIRVAPQSVLKRGCKRPVRDSVASIYWVGFVAIVDSHISIGKLENLNVCSVYQQTLLSTISLVFRGSVK